MTLESDTRVARGHEGDELTPDPGICVDDVDEWDGNSDTMDALLAAVAAAPSVPLDRTTGLSIPDGTVVSGTYRVLRRLGGGGMGVVYLAEDIELQRKVALKLHLGEVDSQELMRLQREARVMARLAHPNVLTVHGFGTHEGRLFIVMEYAEGGTLKSWLETGTHSWRDTVAMMVQAGRGLAAAHHVGVVHRDFKPDNVLIGADGRPRVADFGLARRWDEAVEPVPRHVDASLPLSDAHRFTVTGAVIGTPAYMSPEQFDGIEVGPASDQFAFSVVLYEALIGRRPFAGRTTLELAASVHTGQIEPVPRGIHVPRRLLALVTRGLRPVPGDRYPSMEALVDALERIHGARRRRARWSAGGITLAAALWMGNQIAVMTTPEPCDGVEDELGAAWSETRRDAVLATLPERGGASSEAAAEVLDGWVTAWKAQRREVCEATHVRHTQSDLAFTLRTACLERMAVRLDALTDELIEGGEGEPSLALLREELPALEQCKDVEQLDRLVNRFSSESLRSSAEQDRAWSEAEALLTRAIAREQLGRPGWVSLAEQALELAQRHDLVVVEASALLMLSRDRTSHGDTVQATAMADRALRLAISAGHYAVVTDIVLGRVQAALSSGRSDEAALHLSYFDAVVTRIRQPELLEGYLLDGRIARGRMYGVRGEAEAAIRELAPLVDDPSVDGERQRQILDIVAGAHERLARHAEALAMWGQLIQLVEHDGDPSELVLLLNNMAIARLSLGQLDEALEDLTRAESIVTRELGAEYPYLVAILTNQGVAHRRLGRLEQALALQERSLALRVELYGDAHPSLAYALDELGELARLRGDAEVALGHLGRALRLREDGLGPDHPLVAETLTLLARAHLDRQDHARAEGALERADRILGQKAGDPRARAQVALLRARAVEDRDPAGARKWAELAEALAAQQGQAGEALRAEAQAWLRDHATPTLPAPEHGR